MTTLSTHPSIYLGFSPIKSFSENLEALEAAGVNLHLIVGMIHLPVGFTSSTNCVIVFDIEALGRDQAMIACYTLGCLFGESGRIVGLPPGSTFSEEHRKAAKRAKDRHFRKTRKSSKCE